MQSPNLRFGDSNLFELPTRVKYALLALMELAQVFPSEKAMTVKEIVNKQPIPERYLEQVLLSLRQSGLVQSYRGARGGYLLNKEPWSISVLEVVISVEGQQNLPQSSSLTSGDSLIIQEIWLQANMRAQEILEKQTIGDLCQQSRENRQNSLMYQI